MKKIIEDNYKSIVDRGFITPTTTLFEFLDKLEEETEELIKEALKPKQYSNLPEELADVIMVCLNMAKHYNIDIEQEIKNKIEVNKQRAKNGK